MTTVLVVVPHSPMTSAFRPYRTGPVSRRPMPWPWVQD